MRPMGQEPISCFCSVRQLDVQVHPLDMTLVCRRDLPPIQPLMLSLKQGGTGSHFFRIFGMTRPGFEPRSPSLRADTQTTKPVHGILAILGNHNIGVDMTVCIIMPVSGFMSWFYAYTSPRWDSIQQASACKACALTTTLGSHRIC